MRSPFGWWHERRMKSAAEATFDALRSIPDRDWYVNTLLTVEPRLRRGTIYAALARLEAEGLVSSRWESLEKLPPRRRVYTLTAHGKARSDAIQRNIDYHRKAKA